MKAIKTKVETRGGVRPGAGRPAGTIKNNLKKPVSLRLSVDVVAFLKKNQSLA